MWDARCPQQFVLDSCFALVVLAVLAPCRLLLLPANASAACQAPGFDGSISGARARWSAGGQVSKR
jgi:hypothetical protein